MRFAKTLVLSFTAALAAAVAPAQAGALPPELEESLKKTFETFTVEHGALFERLDPNDYRHPYERKVVAALMKDQKIKDLMPEALKVAKEFNDQYHKAHLLQGVLVSEKQFPDIHKMAQENAKALSMKGGFKIYVMNSAQMNAYTWSIDQDNYGVALFSGIIKALSTEELRFVLAHEMGHVKSKHILSSILVQLYAEKHGSLPPVFGLKDNGSAGNGKPDKKVLPTATLGMSHLPSNLTADLLRRVGSNAAKPMNVTEDEEANLQRFGQACEYSSDRAGIVASGKRLESMMGLVKLASGHVGDLGGFDMDTYLKQIETVLATMSREDLRNLMGSEGSHAFTLMRVGELDLFFKSDEYQKAAAEKGAGVFKEIVSAYQQITSVLVEANKELEKFRSGTTASEMNALERRLKEKELAERIEPRTAAEGKLSPVILDTIAKLGLGVKDNAAFDIFESYSRVKANGVAVKSLCDKLTEKINFELANGQPDEATKLELERKAKVVKELAKLKPGAAASDDDDEDEDEEKSKK